MAIKVGKVGTVGEAVPRLLVVLALAGLASGARADTIELKNGDKLEGVIVIEKDEDRIVAEHPVLGRLEIPREDIAPPKEKKEKPGIFGTSFLAGFSRAISAGFDASTGKSKDSSVNADLHVSRETKEDRDKFVAQYFFSSEDGERSDNELEVRHLHDFLFTDTAWFLFAAGRYDYDEFQQWDHRLGGSGGVGYAIVSTDAWLVTGRLGAGFTHFFSEEHVSSVTGDVEKRDRTTPDGAASLDFRWNIADGHTLEASAFYFPVLNDLPAFRSVSRAEWKIGVGMIQGLAFKIGLNYEYDSKLEGNANDRKYYGNLVYEF